MLPNMDPLDIYPQYSYNPAPAPPNVDPEGILGWKSVYWDIVPDGTWKRCASPYHYQDRRAIHSLAWGECGQIPEAKSSLATRRQVFCAYTILAEINPFDHFAHEVLMVTFASTIQNAVDNEVRRRLHQQHCIRENQAAEVFQETLSEIYAWLTDDPPRFVFHCDDTYRGITEVYDLADKSKKPLPFGVVDNSNLDGRLVELLTLPDLLTAHFRKRAWRIANRIIHREKGQYYLPQTKKRRALQLPPDEVWSMEQATLSGDDEIVPARVNRHLEESIAKKSEESLYDLREIVRRLARPAGIG